MNAKEIAMNLRQTPRREKSQKEGIGRSVIRFIGEEERGGLSGEKKKTDLSHSQSPRFGHNPPRFNNLATRIKRGLGIKKGRAIKTVGGKSRITSGTVKGYAHKKRSDERFKGREWWRKSKHKKKENKKCVTLSEGRKKKLTGA